MQAAGHVIGGGIFWNTPAAGMALLSVHTKPAQPPASPL
jgi:hypothetical protein